MTQNQLRGALIGAGGISAFHLEAWKRIPQTEIVAIADTNLQNAQARASEFNIANAYTSFSDLLHVEKNLDFVDIVTPVDARIELVKLATEHGLNINCQKPFAKSLADARTMIRMAQEANVLLNINENWRRRPWYRTIKQLLQDNKIGRVVYARFWVHGSYMRINKLTKNHPHWQDNRGNLFNWGIHHIDVMRFLFGEPATVYAAMTRVPAELKAENRAMLTLMFEQMPALLDLSSASHAPWGHPDRTTTNVEDVRIEGERGAILLIPDPEKGDLIQLISEDENWTRPAYTGRPIDAYQQSYVATQRHFVDCLLGGQTPETHALDNYETLAVTLAAYESARQNQVINIADFKDTQ